MEIIRFSALVLLDFFGGIAYMHICMYTYIYIYMSICRVGLGLYNGMEKKIESTA